MEQPRTKKYQRVILLLEDGRKRYAIHNGELELWKWCEVDLMQANRKRYGDAAFTTDFRYYDTTVAGLQARFPNQPIIRVVGFETEDHDLPINESYIF